MDITSQKSHGQVNEQNYLSRGITTLVVPFSRLKFPRDEFSRSSMGYESSPSSSVSWLESSEQE